MLFDPGCSNCGCPTAGVSKQIAVYCCSTTLAPGVTVNAWTSSAKTVLLASGVTSAAAGPGYGKVTLSLPASGTVWIEAVNPRLVTTGKLQSLPTVAAISLTAATASGYHCGPGGFPWRDTVYWSDSATGASIALTYDGRGWSGTGAGTTHATGPPLDYDCPAATIDYRATWWYGYPSATQTHSWGLAWSYAGSCPASFGGAPLDPPRAGALSQVGGTIATYPFPAGVVGVVGSLDGLLAWAYSIDDTGYGPRAVFGRCYPEAPCAFAVAVTE